MRQSWIDDYQPDTATFTNLLLETADAEWLLRRVAAQYDVHQRSLNDDPLQWSEEDHKQLERFTRYRTTAERRFLRFRNAVEQTRKSRELEAHRKRQLELVLEKEQAQAARKSSKDRAVPHDPEPSPSAASSPLSSPRPEPELLPYLNQTVEVRIENGKTVTALYPSNDELFEQYKTQVPPVGHIYRTMHFCDGFPPEYEWAKTVGTWTSDGRQQVLTPAQWLAAIEREQFWGSGHIGPVDKSEGQSSETKQTATEQPGPEDVSGPERQEEPAQDCHS